MQPVFLRTLAVSFLCAISMNAFPTSCRSENEQLERTVVLFSGVVKGIMLEPEGVEVPAVAKVPIDIPADLVENLPVGEELTIEGCSDFCFNWTGTEADLPATYIRPWLLFYVDVHDVWRGNVEPKEKIYVVGHRMPDIGQKFVMGFYDTQVSPLSYVGTCQPLLAEDTLEEFLGKDWPPIYSYHQNISKDS